MDKNLFKDLYQFELTRRDQLSASGNLLITSLAIVGGLIGYLVDKHSFGWDALSFAFSIFMGIGLLTYASAIYYLFRLYHVGRYYAIPTSSDLRNYYDMLQSFYRENQSEAGSADSTFESYLNRRYAEATDTNAQVNYSRGTFQTEAFNSLAYTVIFALVSAVPHFVKAHMSTPLFL